MRTELGMEIRVEVAGLGGDRADGRVQCDVALEDTEQCFGLRLKTNLSLVGGKRAFAGVFFRMREGGCEQVVSV